ncbi:DoxX family protein [Nocardioides luteus]|uniref:Invasion protein n=1 Tax=Nocardioides luteus TaxID=1844 RepID=A0A1J4N7K9_9ACTN|nr:DoxX family protein [Nocardioides luteus]OIJ27478.1 invasion protein [Nocardioides luteus]
MNTLTVLTVALAAVFTALGAAKLLAVPAMVQRAAHVGFGVAAYRGIGALEIAGAAGLLLGTVSRSIPIAAAIGLLLLLGGAAIVHFRAGDGAKEAAPALVLGGLVVVALALRLGGL